MFNLFVNKNQIKINKMELITSGSVNVYKVQFDFSEDWKDLDRMAVFKAGIESRSVLLDNGNICEIPWEVLKKPGLILKVGVFGNKYGEMVLPTIWSELGVISLGVTISEDTNPPTPDIWEQIVSSIPKPMTSDDLRKILIGGAGDD